MRPAREFDSLPLLTGLLVLFVAFVAMAVRTAPPRPLASDAPGSAFSADRALEVLRGLVGDDTPHPIGSEANASVRERVVQAFVGLGYEPEMQMAFACSGTDQACGTVQNVVARWPGIESGPAVLVSSHYDSVAAGPGASDAGVSVAVILEVARALAAEPPARNPIIFLVDDGEEAGLLGASAFVAGHPLAREVGAVVNLEARGTSGPSVMFETSRENGWLIERLAASLGRPVASSLFYPIYEQLPNDTDLTVFKAAGWPGVNFAFIGDGAKYHTPLDRIGNASPSSLQHQGQNALAMVRALAGADLANPPPGRVVFFDVLGVRLMSWRVEFTTPLAILAFLMIAITTLVARRLDDAPLRRGAIGLIAWIASVGLAGLGTLGLLRWLIGQGAWPGGSTTQPVLAVLAFWIAGMALATLAAVAVSRWTQVAGAWSGCWLGWSLAGLAAAYYFPEASYILIVPALVAGVCGLAGVSLRGRSAGAVAAMLPLVTAAVLIMPSAWMLFDALGPTALPIAGTAIALVATALAPLGARASRIRWLVPAVAFLAAGGLSVASLRTPAFSAERPERMNLAFFQMTGEASARWVVSPQSGVLPDGLREAAPFGAERETTYPWSQATAFVADADPTKGAAPELVVLERGERDGRRVARVRVRSARGATTLTLLLPRRAVPIRIGGLELPPRPADADARPSQRDPGGALRGYTSHAVPPEGLEIELVIDGDDPVDGYLVDRSSGLPPSGVALAAARPAEATPSGAGDVTIFARRISVD